jgi:hypothetical protein
MKNSTIPIIVQEILDNLKQYEGLKLLVDQDRISWWITIGDTGPVIEYREGQGFGLTINLDSVGYGEGAEFIFETKEELLEKIRENYEKDS